MNAKEFQSYLSRRLHEVAAELKNPDTTQERRKQLGQWQGTLETMAKLTCMGGPAARRARRDFERRCAARGVALKP